MDINKRALDLANHLLDVEVKCKLKKQKKKDIDIEKFIKSTLWLSKRILSNYAFKKIKNTVSKRQKQI